MRISTKFGSRTQAENKEVNKKFFMVYEGEKTEFQYFNGISKNKSQLNFNTIIEIKPILQSWEESGWSNPKKILDRLIRDIELKDDDTLPLNVIIMRTIDMMDEEKMFGGALLTPKIIKKYLLDCYSKNGVCDFHACVDIVSTIDEVVTYIKQISSLKITSEKLKEYIEEQRILYDDEIDELCLIVDRDKKSFVDHENNNQYEYVLNRCKEKNINFYLSNPCFELWLLMHFDAVHNIDKKMALENEKVQGDIRYVEYELRNVVHGWKKKNIKFQEFLPNISKAINNEKFFCEDIEDLKDNIGSNIGLLMTKIINNE